jgi:glycosyltransferase involved in cell wall biosynthesis
VLPSIDEAFGVAYIEAMAAAIPAIGSRGEPGPEEIAACGGGMRLVPPGDPEALRLELRRVLDADDLRADLVHAGDLRVEEFSLARLAERYIPLYETAAAVGTPQ